MQPDADFRSILVADCGSEQTRVTLVDLVEGNEYRMVGQQELPTTVEPPISNLTVAIRQAILELERNTGRQLMEDEHLKIPQGRDGQGLDAFVATCSAGGSIPMLVMAVTSDITAQSAVYAIEGTYAVPFRVVTMEEVLRDAPLSPERVAPPVAGHWWKVAQDLYPGGVLLVGGVDGGNVAPLRTLARALRESLPPRAARLEQELAGPPLPVIYAGNRQARDVVREQLEDQVELRIVENLRPHLGEEQILPCRQEIVHLYQDQILHQLPGYEELSSWSSGPVQLPYVGLQLVTRFLSMHHERQVLALDVGGGSTTAVWADSERSWRAVLGHFGLGRAVGRVLAQRGVERIKQWLPFAISEERIREWVLNQSLRPRTLPTTVRDCLLQQALAREAVAEAAERLWQRAPSDFEIVVATGSIFSRAPRWTQAAMILLDVLQPTCANTSGLVDLYVDRSSLLPSIGAIATLNPDAAASVLLKDGLHHLGACLVPLGRGRQGSRALELEIEYRNEMRQQIEVAWGELQFIPFRWGSEAHLRVKPARGTRIGSGRPGEILSTAGGERIRSGVLGLIVDARGRPLEIPSLEEERHRRLQEWLGRSGAFTEEELASLAEESAPAAEHEEVPPEMEEEEA